jgi:hypothetical protein
LEELREEFLTNYLELLGLSNFKELDRDQKRDCLAAWKDEKLIWREDGEAAA